MIMTVAKNLSIISKRKQLYDLSRENKNQEICMYSKRNVRDKSYIL